MKNTTMKFYSKGTDNQKRADIGMILRRTDIKQMQKWTAAQRILAKAFIKDCEVRFERWKKQIEAL